MQFTFWHESSVENLQSTLNKTSSLYTSVIFAPVLKVNQSFSFKYALQELPEPLGSWDELQLIYYILPVIIVM